MDSMESSEFELLERYFTLEEAAALIPQIIEAFRQAHSELEAQRDQVILYKRLHMSRQEEAEEDETVSVRHEEEVLQQKWQAYEKTFKKWVQYFLNQGILLRDMERGLIDFPYRSRQGEEFFLCWQREEDGLFYFHEAGEGFMGRKPISLLPD